MKTFLIFLLVLLAEANCKPVEKENKFYPKEKHFNIIWRPTRSLHGEYEEASGYAEDFEDSMENRADSCHFPPASGPCFAHSTRYFYNTSSMACESFQYGGCLGNHNNFPTEQECLRICRTKASCNIPILTGSCKMSKIHWAFDMTQNKCVTFQYGGCNGNSNRFDTEKECKDFCGVSRGEDEGFL